MKNLSRLFCGLALLAMSTAMLAASPAMLKIQKQQGRDVLTARDNQNRQIVFGWFDHPEDAANLPAEVRSFFTNYESAMACMNAGVAFDELFAAPRLTSGADTVGPLLGKIEYDQSYPYNNKCPVLNGGRAVTGCVATGMAQVMRYYKYPACGTGTAKYTGGSQGEATYDFSAHPFDWDNMLEQYTSSATGNPRFNTAQADAVAELMLACGASVNMDYSKEESGSHTAYAATALKNNFGYSSKVKAVETSDVGNEYVEMEWTWTLQDELDLGHPVIFGGTSTQGGHCFVIDGYTVTDNVAYFHVNWGWSGSYNGWFLLTLLRPVGTTNYWSQHETMILGCEPEGWTALEDVKASSHAVKRIENGQLIIEKNGRRFNALGQEL